METSEKPEITEKSAKPETKPDISPEYAEAIELLKGYIDETGKSQEVVAKDIGGYRGPLVSQFLAGTYKSADGIIPKVKQMVKTHNERKARPIEPPFSYTTVSRMVTGILTYCHLQGKFGVVYGDAGVGKTMACREYCRQNVDALMVTADPCYASVAGLADLLAQRVNVKERVARRVFEGVSEKLSGTSRVLIVDEAQHLTVKAIDQLRSINDNCGAGVALVGNEAVYTKMRDGTSAELAQLFSRIGMRTRVQTGNISAEDIAAIFKGYELEDDSKEYLYKISRTNYGLRGAVNVFVNSMSGFKLEGASGATAPRLARVAKEMGIA